MYVLFGRGGRLPMLRAIHERYTPPFFIDPFFSRLSQCGGVWRRKACWSISSFTILSMAKLSQFTTMILTICST